TIAQLAQLILDAVAQGYVAQQPGKGLSQNDFTNAEKDKLDSLNAVKKYRGQVAAVADLPTTGNAPGDTYFVGAAAPYEEYIWTGSQWFDLGQATGNATSYDALTDKPQIGGVELSGNKTAAQLGLAAANDVVKTSGNQTVNGEKTFRAKTTFGTDVRLGFGARNIKMCPEDNTQKNIQLFDDDMGVNCYFKLNCGNKATIYNLPAPVNTGDAANKAYVDQASDNAVKLSGNQTVNGEKTFRAKTTFGTDVRLGFGARNIKMCPEDNTQKNIQLFDDDMGVNCYFKLNCGNKATIYNLPAPVNTGDAANKAYVDQASDNAVKLSGNQTVDGVKAFSDSIELTGTGEVIKFVTSRGNAAHYLAWYKNNSTRYAYFGPSASSNDNFYFNLDASGLLQISAGTISFNNCRLQNVAMPTADTDAATKAYVDALKTQIKDAVANAADFAAFKAAIAAL
ncbi:MAG: hypothetical protein NC548_38170, partial [Lachnospiraceae bacterium]|nr:hypothetical protein [Lachnospiraceae bacterium]